MNLPKMILFDCGHTLLYEPGSNSLRGTKALMPYITKNPGGFSAEEIDSYEGDMYRSVFGTFRKRGVEIPSVSTMRLAFQTMQLEFSLPYDELEMIFWDNMSPGENMPYVDEMLHYVSKRNIRFAVISNIGFSEKTLRARIRRLLPNYDFEFVIASSEYGIRKPNPLIFDLALKKANLSASDVWFCGDSPTADVEGAAAVGIFPVLYEDLTVENPWRELNNKEPNCEHLHIHDLRELVAMLDGLR